MVAARALGVPIPVKGPLADRGEWICRVALALLLALCAATVADAAQVRADEVDVHLLSLPSADGQPSRLSADGRAPVVPGGHRQGDQAARVQFSLPPANAGESRWVVWVGRDAVDRVALAGEGWRSAERGFFSPTRDEGLLPAGYQFPLPSNWSGDKTLVLGARGTLRGALRIRILRETVTMRLEQRGAVLGAVIYAALFMLTLLMLALLAVVCLLDIAVVGIWMLVAGVVLWVVAVLIAIALMAHAARRREQTARVVVLAVIVYRQSCWPSTRCSPGAGWIRFGSGRRISCRSSARRPYWRWA